MSRAAAQPIHLVIVALLLAACSTGGSGTDNGKNHDSLPGSDGLTVDAVAGQDGRLPDGVSVPTDSASAGDGSEGEEGVGTPELTGDDQSVGPDGCTPLCDGLECGPDGCGGQCGKCEGSNSECQDGTCQCTPDTCESFGYACGTWPDGCGAVAQCGECDQWPNSFCNEGTCDCAPNCFDKECGLDGCGGSCGLCVCGNQLCEEGEDEGNCAADCGPCGDGVCGAGEDPAVCAKDCASKCGDGNCGAGETSDNCPYDCPKCGDGICSPGEEGAGCLFECGFGCGDGQCAGLMENSVTCPQDCPPQCGDGLCVPPETALECATDCTTCGDGACTGTESELDCPEDCIGLCGNGICQGAESPDDCPVDCGACGDGTCGFLEDEVQCPVDCSPACGDGECQEDEDEKTCPEDCGCLPDCAGKECGLDDCGFDCGACGDHATCGNDHQCTCDFLECGGDCCAPSAICYEAACCAPDCTGKTCGDDGCGGSCGSCPLLEVCQAGQCACQFTTCQDDCCQFGQTCHEDKCCAPDCENKECGDNGCGGSCGQCGFAHECEVNACVWQVFCGNGLCEPDSGEDCIACPNDCACGAEGICMEDGSCCPLQCAGKECGPDGCGGQCGTCSDLSTCTAGQCLCDYETCGETCCAAGAVCYQGACCQPQCDGKDCGDNTCGGSCGDCGEGFACVDNICQCDNVLWSRNLGDKKNDLIYGVSERTGGYYAAGRTEELLDYHDYWVSGVDSNGFSQWSKNYTGSGSFSTDIAFAVTTDSEGNAVAVGKQDSGTWYNAVARKFQPDGTAVWGKTFGGNGLNEFRDVVAGDGGTTVSVGQTFSGYTYKGWAVELNADGSTKTSKTYQASGAFDVLRGIEKVSTGGYIAVGCSGLGSIDNEDYVSPGQLWLLRLDANLNQTWSKKVMSSSEGFAVAETADGYVAVGYQWNGSNRDVVVVRTDSSGNKLWDKVFGWNKDDVARDVLVTANDTFLVTGYATGPGKSDQDLLLFEMSGAGAIYWQSFIGGSSTQAGYALLPFTGEAGHHLVGGRNSGDGWLLKVGGCY